MIVCGVDIKTNDAIMVLVGENHDLAAHVKCDTKKLTLNDDKDATSLRTMSAAIIAFAQKHEVDVFVIKSRQSLGQRASGGITFKIEALFQLSDTPVAFVSPLTLAKFAKGNKGGIPTGLLKYQEDAYRAGAWRLTSQ